MATFSTTYGNMKSQPITSGAAGSNGLLGYQLPTSALRRNGDSTTINTLGNLTQDQRIDKLASNQYEKAAAGQEANNMFMQNMWNTSLNSLNSASAADRNVIFDSWRSTGLLPPVGGDRQWQGGNGPKPGSTEEKSANYNNSVFGAVNRMSLANQGIDPNSIANAYQRLMGRA